MPLPCCADTAVFLRGDLDTPLPVGALPWLARGADREGLALVLQIPSEGSWSSWPLFPRELPALLDGCEEAWVVQRPGCGGLVTRVLLLDTHGSVLAALAADREPGQGEPIAWRVLLLMALLAESCADGSLASGGAEH